MNKVILMGRLTRDPETRYSTGAQATAVCRYSLAVDRSYKRDGEPDVDFINIVAFGNRGEFANKYFKKGMQVAVVGELRINSYNDKDGNKRTSTEVIVSEQFFGESKASFESRRNSNSNFAPAAQNSGYNNGYNNGGYANNSYAQAAPQAPAAPQQSYEAPASSFAAAPADPASQVPAYNEQPAASSEGFMPLESEVEGDEDLPF